MAETRNTRRTLYGTVTSTRCAQTITVDVERTFKHARYGKYVRRKKKYLAHDPEQTASAGDLVQIEATRPISKRKRWRLVSVLERSELIEQNLSPDAELAEAAAAEGGES